MQGAQSQCSNKRLGHLLEVLWYDIFYYFCWIKKLAFSFRGALPPIRGCALDQTYGFALRLVIGSRSHTQYGPAHTSVLIWLPKSLDWHRHIQQLSVKVMPNKLHYVDDILPYRHIVNTNWLIAWMSREHPTIWYQMMNNVQTDQ